MHYFIDAYNLMFRILRKKGSLQQRRQMMIEELNESACQSNLHVTLVFDGAEEHFSLSGREHFDHIELVYTSKSTTADEYITEEVARAKTPTSIAVVTNDRELGSRCRTFRAKTLTIEEFITFIAKKKDRKKKRSIQPVAGLRASSAEFKRLLQIFEKKLKAEEEDDS